MGSRGFTALELMVAVAIVLIVAAITVPNLQHYRMAELAKVCVANLQTVQTARVLYTLDHETGTIPLPDTLASLGYFGHGTSLGGAQAAQPRCPWNNQTYLYSTVRASLYVMPRCPNNNIYPSIYSNHTLVLTQ